MISKIFISLLGVVQGLKLESASPKFVDALSSPQNEDAQAFFKKQNSSEVKDIELSDVDIHATEESKTTISTGVDHEDDDVVVEVFSQVKKDSDRSYKKQKRNYRKKHKQSCCGRLDKL